MKTICQTWELVESKENHLGTLQLDLSPESSVSEWLLKDQDKHLAARLDKDETLPNLLLYANGFVHFATTATTAKDTAKDTTKESLQKGDYSSVGEGERNGGGCVAVFVSPTVVELRAEAGAPYPFSYGNIRNFGAVGTLRLELVEGEEEHVEDDDDSKQQQKQTKGRDGAARMYPRLKGTLSYDYNPEARTYMFTGFQPDDDQGREARILFTKEDYLMRKKSEQERELKQRKERRDRWERLMPSSMVLEPGESDNDELEFYGSDKQYVAEFRPPWMTTEDNDSNDVLDWSGRPGHRCSLCNRRSEGVGPRRGFNYKDGYCGGCVG